jgi:hypothetical protein
VSEIELKDVVVEGLDYLIDFWEDKPLYRGTLESYLREAQNLEDATYALLTERGIYTAIGTQLDVIGNNEGEARQGLEDEPYRAAILRRIAINSADGTTPVILDILSSISGSPVPNIFEHYPASFHAYIDRGLTHALAKILNESAAAGVGTTLMFDNEGDSFIGSEIIEQEYAAVFEDGDIFIVTDTGTDYTLVYSGDRDISTNGRSYLPEDVQAESINPMCDVIDDTAFFGEIGVLLLENDDALELENGDLLEYQIIEYQISEEL